MIVALLSSRRVRFGTFVLLASCLLAAAGESVQAQSRRGRTNAVPRYQPPTPTVSPYLNLLRPEGPIPNYYALVRPLQRQEQFNRQTMAFQERQAQEVERLQRQFAQPQVLPTGTAGWFFDEGRQPPFGNTSHYYQVLQPQFRGRPVR